MFPAPLLPTDSRLYGSAMERSGGHLFLTLPFAGKSKDANVARRARRSPSATASSLRAAQHLFDFRFSRAFDFRVIRSGFLVTPGLSRMGETT